MTGTKNTKPARNATILLFLFCLIGTLAVSFFYHDRFWWGPDDGYFSYYAQLVLEGEVLHRDVQEMHPGLIHFVNAAFLKIANGDPVGLRYPLIILTLIQMSIAFFVARPLGLLTSISAAAIAVAFGFVQFINPTPHWYTLTLAILAAFYMSTRDLKITKTLIVIGFLVGLIFLFRQLTGFIVASAATLIVFNAHTERNATSRKWAGSVVLTLLFVGLAAYVFKSANIFGVIFLAPFPLIFLMYSAYRINLNLSQVMRIISFLSLGALISAIPLILYHVAHGSIFDWLNDVFITPFKLVGMPFFDDTSYIALPAFAIKQILSGDLSAIGGLVYWIILLFSPFYLGVITLKKLVSSPDNIPVWGILACFYVLVSVHYEIPIYLTYSTAIVWVAILLSRESLKRNIRLSVIALCLSFCALWFHAAQPLDRNLIDTATNKRAVSRLAYLPQTSIRVDLAESQKYGKLLFTIDQCIHPKESIFAFPTNAEIYFLSGRKSAFPFVMSNLGLHSDSLVKKYADQARQSNSPALIVHRLEDKYNNAYADQLFASIKPLYTFVGRIEDFDLYLRKDRAAELSCRIIPSHRDKK